MIRVTAALLHFPDLPIKIGPCRNTDFYSLSTGEPQELCGPELTVYFTQAQLEDIRDQITALFPLPALGHPLNLSDAADPRDFPGSIAPSLLAGGEVSP